MRLLTTCILCACVVAMAAVAGADGGGSRLPLPLRYASRMIREHSSLPPFFRTSASPPSFEQQPDTTCAEGEGEAGATDPLMSTRGGSTRVKRGRTGSVTAAQKKAAVEYKARQQQAGKNANKARRKKVSPAAPPAKKTKPAASAAAKAKTKATTKKGAAAAAPASTTAASTTSTNPGSGLLTTGSTQMPTLFFTPTEADLDRYAACLAAAEGLRRARDSGVASSRVKRALQDIDSGKLDASTSKNKAKDRMMKRWSADERKEFDTLRASYALNTAKMVRSLGLSVARFNQLGKVVGSDPVLKERVMEPADLYGMAAGLTGMEKDWFRWWQQGQEGRQVGRFQRRWSCRCPAAHHIGADRCLRPMPLGGGGTPGGQPREAATIAQGGLPSPGHLRSERSIVAGSAGSGCMRCLPPAGGGGRPTIRDGQR